MSGRVLILLILLVLGLLVQNLNASELDWQELQKYLDESKFGLQMTEEGLQMIELPLTEIDNLQMQKEQRLVESEQDLMQKELQQKQKENFLNKRELELNEREKVIESREKDSTLQLNLLEDMGKDLAKANKKLENGWKWLAGSLIVGIVVGILIDELIRNTKSSPVFNTIAEGK